LRSMPPLGPAAYLPFDESRRLAEAGQAVSRDVDCMQVAERVDERLADAAAHSWTVGQRRRFIVPHDNAVPALHDVEDRPDDTRIVAEQVRPRRVRKHRM